MSSQEIPSIVHVLHGHGNLLHSKIHDLILVSFNLTLTPPILQAVKNLIPVRGVLNDVLPLHATDVFISRHRLRECTTHIVSAILYRHLSLPQHLHCCDRLGHIQVIPCWRQHTRVLETIVNNTIWQHPPNLGCLDDTLAHIGSYLS